MKKSLVIISFAFIFLLSMSVVSAESFGMRQTSLNYNGFPGLELSWFGNLFSGKSSGNAIKGGDLSNPIEVDKPKTGFFDNIFDFFGGGEPAPPEDEPIPPLDEGEFIEDTGFGGESCEFLDIEEAVLYPGDVGENGGILNNRFIDFDEDEVLIIDETFATQLKEGGRYLVPIPNQECYWETSYEDGELYMVTVCYADEEIV